MEKTIAEQLSELKEGLETLTKTEIKAAVDGIEAQIKAVETKADKTEVEELKKQLTETKEALAKNQKWIDEEISRGKRGKIDKQENKSFNEILGEAIEANKEKLQNTKPGEYSESNPLRIPLMPELKQEGQKPVEVKAVGDMNVANNFPGATSLYQDARTNLIETPYNKVWLSDILPSSTSNGTQVVYPKENGGEGGAGVWTDYTQNKPQIDWDLTAQTAYFKWIAGWVIVQRDMLDDIPFFSSYLQSRLLISLKTAENNVIINGTNDTNPIQGFEDVATPYNGTYTNGVDRIIDAGWGQIVDGTSEFYSPTHAVVRPRDSVKLGLNKAGGSGEYDLPEGSVAFVNGKLTIGGITVVPTTAMLANTFYVLDRRAFDFVRRIQPELRMFEDATLAKKNQVMFRIEERVTLVNFNSLAIIKGVLGSS